MTAETSDVDPKRRRFVLEELKRMVAPSLEDPIEPDAIDDQSPLFEGGLGLDSVVLVEIMSGIEDRFDFLFLDSDLSAETFRNLDSLATLVASRTEP